MLMPKPFFQIIKLLKKLTFLKTLIKDWLTFFCPLNFQVKFYQKADFSKKYSSLKKDMDISLN